MQKVRARQGSALETVPTYAIGWMRGFGGQRRRHGLHNCPHTGGYIVSGLAEEVWSKR